MQNLYLLSQSRLIWFLSMAAMFLSMLMTAARLYSAMICPNLGCWWRASLRLGLRPSSELIIIESLHQTWDVLRLPMTFLANPSTPAQVFWTNFRRPNSFKPSSETGGNIQIVWWTFEFISFYQKNLHRWWDSQLPDILMRPAEPGGQYLQLRSLGHRCSSGKIASISFQF